MYEYMIKLIKNGQLIPQNQEGQEQQRQDIQKLEYITVNMSNLRKAIQMVQSSVSNLDVKEHEEFNEKYGEKWLKEEMNEEFQTRLSRFSQSMYKLVNSKIQQRNLMI